MKARAVQGGGRRARPPASVVHAQRLVEPGEREAMIAEAAYYRAEARGFEAGHELEDWLSAEAEVDLLLEAAEFSDH
jgi:Protein of unknown function (DUF2934)